MATSWLHNQERVPENFTNQLALAVRSMQWSYAIFWDISARLPGVLEWADGYYNGEIKTRKTVQSIELNADQLGLQRSEQLRELYESLSAGEDSPDARRPSAALSPEDLTDTEWYYLVCMSFLFDIGQGLPGRTLANGKPTWLCNAHYADSKVFSRSLLAKSASIQTIVCFPFMSGVIELGMTEKVLEDPSLIQHIKTSFLEIPSPIVAKKSTATSDNEFASATFNHGFLHNTLIPVAGCEELDTTSPNNGSNNPPREDSIMVEGINGVASLAQSWQFMDDDFNNCVHHSMNSSDCVSQTIVDPVKVSFVPNDEQVNETCLNDFQDRNQTKLNALDLLSDDLHYQSVLSCLLKTSNPLVLGSCFQNCHQKSSFINWKKVGFACSQKSRVVTPQKVLKKMLFEVPQMHASCLLGSPEYEGDQVGVWRPKADDIGASHVLSERKRREKLNRRFMVLKSILPSISKTDKVSILDDTIEYLQELQRRVEELESCRGLIGLEARTKRKPQDSVERTSDNYGSDRNRNGKKPLTNKRKACGNEEKEPGMVYNASKDNIAVSVNGDDVSIEVTNPWRDGMLLEIIDAISHLHLDSQSVQSITNEGILFMTIKSKRRGITATSAGTIKQALQRVVRKG